jgi:hypothetical protein
MVQIGVVADLAPVAGRLHNDGAEAIATVHAGVGDRRSGGLESRVAEIVVEGRIRAVEERVAEPPAVVHHVGGFGGVVECIVRVVPHAGERQRIVDRDQIGLICDADDTDIISFSRDDAGDRSAVVVAERDGRASRPEVRGVHAERRREVAVEVDMKPVDPLVVDRDVHAGAGVVVPRREHVDGVEVPLIGKQRVARRCKRGVMCDGVYDGRRGRTEHVGSTIADPVSIAVTNEPHPYDRHSAPRFPETRPFSP